MSKEALPTNQFVCGDLIDVMREWPDNSVDLVFCSTTIPRRIRMAESSVAWPKLFHPQYCLYLGCSYSFISAERHSVCPCCKGVYGFGTINCYREIYKEPTFDYFTD
ncbi:hypothetical protein LCGC14_0376590 [marine sediment metagenome]|uniref:Uncharacterized protein n=1 Tax=marine sediment metagenome TaxID=412755 RepID=A0A0F9WC82_9ZZZZ